MKKQRYPRCYSYRLWRGRLKRMIVLLALIIQIISLVFKVWSLFQG